MKIIDIFTRKEIKPEYEHPEDFIAVEAFPWIEDAVLALTDAQNAATPTEFWEALSSAVDIIAERRKEWEGYT